MATELHVHLNDDRMGKAEDGSGDDAAAKIDMCFQCGDVSKQCCISQSAIVNESSTCFAQRATSLTDRLSECIEEAIAQDLRSSTCDSDGLAHLAIFRWRSCTQVFGDQNHETTYFSCTSNCSIQPLSTCRLLSLSYKGNLCELLSLVGLAMAEVAHVIQNLSSTLWKGFLFPFLSFRFAWRMAFSFMRSCQDRLVRTHTRVKRLVDRIHTTLRGSNDDIGWLQRTPELAPVEDGTDRFVQLLELVSTGIHKLPNIFVYLLVPGLFSNHGPLYFVDTKKYFSKLGLTCHIAKIHSEASVETNALELKNYIEELYWGCGKRVMLFGHSKGGVDAAAAIAKYWPDLKDKVVGLVLAHSPYGGSPIASDILREGQIADLETRHVMELLICKIIKGDIRSLEDLTYDKRREFLAKHPLPSDFPMVSYHTEVSIAPRVISTMSHIAHAELPWLPLPVCRGTDLEEPAATGTKLPVIFPLAAAMAVCALHLELRYGEKSDGLVLRKDAEVPGSVVVRPDRKLDHAWMVYSCSRNKGEESNASQMCEALLTLLLEVSQKKTRGHECETQVNECENFVKP